MVIAIILGSLVLAAVLTPVVMGLMAMIWSGLAWVGGLTLGLLGGAAHASGWLIGRLALVVALLAGVGAGGAAAMAML